MQYHKLAYNRLVCNSYQLYPRHFHLLLHSLNTYLFGADLKESSSVVIQLATFIGLNLYVPCTKPTPEQE
jgi:hypothetical protein